MENNILYCYKYSWDSKTQQFSIRRYPLDGIKEWFRRNSGRRYFRNIINFGIIYNKGTVFLENRDDKKARELFIENYKNRLEEMNRIIKNINSNIKLLETTEIIKRKDFE